jgi:hypothetical protein
MSAFSHSGGGVTALDALRRWIALQPSVSVTEEPSGWTAWHAGVPVAEARAAGEVLVMLPPDVARSVAAGRDGVRVEPQGVRLTVSDEESATFARSLLARLIGVVLFAWQYRADGV